MARLRAAIWQSIFSHDLARYRRGLHARMARPRRRHESLVAAGKGSAEQSRLAGSAQYVDVLVSMVTQFVRPDITQSSIFEFV